MRALKKPAASITISLIVILCFYYFLNSTSSLQEPKPLDVSKDPAWKNEPVEPVVKDSTTQDTVEIPFMPKMANETVKAELGRASWKLFHTVLARYPDKPTREERTTLEQYIYLFAKVYPCGDCARHFIKLLKKYPPQTSSRIVASIWGCDVHNKVNKILKHPIYDCTNIVEDYDCGCGDDEDPIHDENLKPKVEKNEGKKRVFEKEHLRFEFNNEDKQLGG